MFKRFSKVAGFFGYFIQYGCLTHCTFEYVGDFVICSGPSMEPTIYSNNILITERITPRLNAIQRGDIIIAKCPKNPAQHICKRVIGLPGDRINVKPALNINPFKSDKSVKSTVDANINNSNREYKNNTESNESYSMETESIADNTQLNDDHNVHDVFNFTRNLLTTNTIVVPRGHVWIEGDNSVNSSDSRAYGPIPQGLIRSRAICRLWPLHDMKSFF